jgi:MoxR-like ATPase
MIEAPDRVRCELDGAKVHYLPSHLAEAHGMTVEEYLKQFPDAELESEEVRAVYEASAAKIKRVPPPPPDKLVVEVGGQPLAVNHDVPEDACLPLPAHYRLPKHGGLGQAVKRAILYFRAGRSHWIWGPPGSGKDALVSALCALTRTPSTIFQISPDVDILPWFYQRSFDRDGTSWEFGELFNALVYGYVSPMTGRAVPMTIVLSEFDRSSTAQAETFRLVTDSILRRVKGPKGETYDVLPGTRVVITANTMGGGDSTGKYRSANVLDTSILNRIERKVKFPPMDWRDEEPIVRAKFPLFAERCGDLLDKIGSATAVLRRQVQDRNLYGEFSHRDVCGWIGACEDILRLTDTTPTDLIKQGFLSYADGLPDEESRNVALTSVDPYLSGGALPRGDVSHVHGEDLVL